MAVSFSQQGAVGYITLDHAPANSYDLAFMQEFGTAVDDAIGSGAGAVIVRSALEKFFCGGADIKKFLEQFSLFLASRLKRYSLRLRQLRLDLIADEKALKLSARLSSAGAGAKSGDKPATFPSTL